MLVTSMVAASLVLLHVGLAMWVVTARLLRKDQATLHQRQRMHGNLAENAPMFLIVLGLAELQHGNQWVLAASGGLFVIARLAHAYGLGQSMGRSKARFVGISTTWNLMAATALYAVWLGMTA